MLDLSEDGKEVGTADPFLKKEENSSARQRTRILLRKTRRKIPLLVRELAFCSAKQVGGMVTWK